MRKFKTVGSGRTQGSGKSLAIPVDQLGIWTSTLCVINCLVTPIALSVSAVSAHLLPSEERTHRTLAVVIATLGALALVRSYRSHHSLRVRLIMIAGLSCIFGGAFVGDQLPSHWAEVPITVMGSGFMIAAHRMNHTFCRDCICSQSD
jgi:hypothetical protein